MQLDWMINFLEETIEAIKDSEHTVQDVMFVGSEDGKYRVAWEEFEEIADFHYDSSYGNQIIAMDLIVYFKDHSWLERFEYDGAEYWEIVESKNFSEDDKYKSFTKLKGAYDTLDGLNDREERWV